MQQSGPFASIESGNAIMQHMKDAVLPAEKAIQVLALKVFDYKPTLLNSFQRAKFSEISEEYRVVSGEFLRAYKIFQTPDELFKQIQSNDSQKAAMYVSDLMRFSPAAKPHFDECFRLLEIIDRSLTRYSESSDQRVATILSLTAISVSIMVAIFK
jgi:hypothetical protein